VTALPAAPAAVRQACEQDQHRYLDHLMRDEELQSPVMMPGTTTLQVSLDNTVLAYIVSCQGLAKKADDEPESKRPGKVGFAIDFWYGPTGTPLEMTSGFQATVNADSRLRSEPARSARRQGRPDTGLTFQTIGKPPAIEAAFDALFDRQLRPVQERFYPLRFTPYAYGPTCTEWRYNGAVIGYFDSGLAGTKGNQGRFIGAQACNLVGPDGGAVYSFGRSVEPLGAMVFQQFTL
jgi:hypothetical protein